MWQVIVVGGGLAGLLNAIELSRTGLKVLLVEQKKYPFHRVCGEYISHEVTPFLKSLGLYPQHLQPVQVDTLKISTPKGRLSVLKLPLGGFGISRFQLDHFWYQQALDSGVTVKQGVKVRGISYYHDHFQVVLDSQETEHGQLVIGAFGKRSNLDKILHRNFMRKRSPYVGVKYHLKAPWNEHEIALHTFEGGYCGVSRVEDQRVNMCYLTHRRHLRKHGSIDALEQRVLTENPLLRELLEQGERIFPQPLVINEISFSPKKAVEEHVLMTGDAAGMITPLCGNGMAMAIRSSHMLSKLIVRYFRDQNYQREQLEAEYQKLWEQQFAYRLMIGRKLQEAFHLPSAMDLLVSLARWPLVGRFIVRQTHGSEFGD